MILTLSNIIIVVLIGICVWLAAKWLFKKDTEIENRRRAAGQLAATLTGMGFKELPGFFLDYSVGDYSGMFYKLTEVGKKLMGGEKAVLAELEDVFVNLLDIKLNTPEGRAQVKAKLAATEAAMAPVQPAAPQVVVVAPAVPVPAAPAQTPATAPAVIQV